MPIGRDILKRTVLQNDIFKYDPVLQLFESFCMLNSVIHFVIQRHILNKVDNGSPRSKRRILNFIYFFKS